jgi:hypothetical protein
MPAARPLVGSMSPMRPRERPPGEGEPDRRSRAPAVSVWLVLAGLLMLGGLVYALSALA